MDVCSLKEKLENSPPDWYALKTFIDGFFLLPADQRLTLIEEEPDIKGDEIQHCLVAGMAEELSVMSGFSAPAWVNKDIYFLQQKMQVKNSELAIIYERETALYYKKRGLLCGPVVSKMHSSIKSDS